MKKIIVWDLCGGSQNSVYHSLKDDERFKVLTFDIVPPQHENQYVLDLTNSKDIGRLYTDFERPDIIVASPLCQSFSFILNAGKKEYNERLGWYYDGQRYRIRSSKEIVELCNKSNFLKQNAKYPERIIQRANIGEKLLESIIHIIWAVQPKCWYIENPEQSLMWDFINKNYPLFCKNNSFVKNNCYYYNYDDNFSKKPTTFLSNINLDLKREIIKNPKFKKTIYTMSRSKTNLFTDGGNNKFEETCARVRIPHNLIKEIFEKFVKKVCNN